MAGIERLTLDDIREAVETRKHGDHNDGGGLVLRIRGATCSWVFRYTAPSGKRREMGLGAVDVGKVTAKASLIAVRAAAGTARNQVRQDIDPLEASAQKRAADTAAAEQRKAAEKAETLTLARAARRYHEGVEAKFRNPKHAQQWINSLEQHVPPELWKAPISRITSAQLLDAVVSISRKLPETGSRVAQRLATVFADCQFREEIDRDPMVHVGKKARELLGAKPEPKHHPALPHSLMAACMADLAKRPGAAARAVRLAILTAARSGEVRGATWAEFSDLDGDAPTWVVPGARMKGGRDHFVPLSGPAAALLREIRDQAGTDRRLDDLVFTSPWSKGVLSPDALEDALDTAAAAIGYKGRATVHGTARSSFSTWAAECTTFKPDVVEAALAHREQDLVRRAYMRAAFEADRRALLAEWGKHCTTKVGEVVTLRAAG